MIRRLAVFLSLFAALAVPAQASGTRAADSLSRLFVQAGYFGFPGYAADPFTCNAQTARTTYYNTVSNTVKFCNGSTWGGLGGITGGGAAASCTASTLLWVDSGGLVQCGAAAAPIGETFIQMNSGSGFWTGSAGTGYRIGFDSQGTATNLIAYAANVPAALMDYKGFQTNQNFSFKTSIASGTWESAFSQVTPGVIRGADTVGATPTWWQNFPGEASLAANYTNATATLSATNLSYTVISGRHYNFDASIYLTDSTAVDGVQVAFDGGTAAATDFIVSCNLTNTGGALAMANSFATALATVINATTTTVTTQTLLECHGMFTPSGNGTFILRAAQNAHTTGTLTFLKGSSLVLRDTKVL